ncbi:stage II sporulation protein P [Clostridium sp. CCUG 7971]|uniref:stage II sporulation protein P n=1 Tax=Clostridium sp. CCUG 7971 TaxID=2811414 RepID=UPI001ABB1E86|nr:stage II sporulation protein P [Clostridium sp. CCUG 7971]MBO3443230.1 stage II sporulation protein P [Clostridium sp. CCUG 7971]
MLRKRIKALSIACVLVCILPIASYSMDKDEFLKFLVNSSYPEAKDDNKEVSKNTKNENKNTEDKQGKDYIKFHVGEENIPKIKSNENNSNNEVTKTTVNTSEYKNDIRVTKESPRILIYHTHSGETYSNSPGGNFHSKDKENSVMAVGSLVTEELNKKGWGVVHTTKYNDYPSFNHAYANSLKTIQSILPKYNSIDIAIDLHRDARDLTNDALKKAEEKRMTTTINGEKVAKFFFVVGEKNPNVEHVRSLAQDITKFAQSKYPELILPVVEKPYGKYNQFVAKNHMLIEVGSNGTSADEAKASAKYVAQILDEYFKQKN